MARRKKPPRPKARSKPSTAKKRSLAAKKAWETRRQQAAARSQAAKKGWITRRRKKRILVDEQLRKSVWRKQRKETPDVDDFADAIVEEFEVTEHDAFSLYYSPGLAA